MSEDEFWTNIIRDDDCWIWLGAINNWGYPGAYYDGRNWDGHRLSHLLCYGWLPPRGWQIAHLCERPPCINPAHLVAMTVRENLLYKNRHGCARCGHPWTPETERWRDGGRGFRFCRLCHNEDGRKNRERQKAAA